MNARLARFPLYDSVGPNFTRALVISAVTASMLALMAWGSRPLPRSPWVTVPESKPITVIDARFVERAPPQLATPPQPAVSKPTPTVKTPQPAPITQPMAAPVAIVEQSTPAPNAAELAAVAPTIDAPSASPDQDRSVSIRESTPIDYPAQARRLGLRGAVLLRIEVGVDGAPLAAEVARSSGHRLLDQTARQRVLTWRFHPARVGGAPVRAWVLLPVSFTLPDG